MSLDSLPHMLAALLMFGNQILMPVPDVDRTDLFICLGANPLASNGSVMTAPDVRGRLKAIRDRGGRVIVLDPRRTETAEKADQHLFIRPGTDAVLLLAMIHVAVRRGLVRARPRAGDRPRRAARRRRGRGRPSAPRRSPASPADDDPRARDGARDDAARGALRPHRRLHAGVRRARRWLCYALNALTGHLDEPGGLMFTTPAVDPLPLAERCSASTAASRAGRSRVSAASPSSAASCR